MLIHFQHVVKFYGAQQVLKDITFEIHQDERIGLIGRNGTGKTTIFNLIKGSFKPDGGQIAIRKDSKIGFLEQIPDYGDYATVYDVLSQSFAILHQYRREMESLESLMAQARSVPTGNDEAGELNNLLAQYGKWQEQFELGGGYEVDARIERIANGLAIPSHQFSMPFARLSGGEKTKVCLAALLLEEPEILLLDEPTNHLDMGAIEWLEQFLCGYPGTVLVISHDRYFLDKVVKKVIEVEDGEATTYYTNYSGFQQEKETRLLQEFANYQEQQKKIKKMKEAIKQLIEWANQANPPSAGLHRRAASMQKALDRMVKLKRPILEREKIGLELQPMDRSGQQVIVFKGLSKILGGRTLFQSIDGLVRYGERVALIGNNGCGKSTLLKILRGEVDPDQGEVHLGSQVNAGYLAQESAPQEYNQTVLQFFRSELSLEEGRARGQLAKFLFYGSDVFKQVKSLSGGEWSRLRLAILMHRSPNLLLLDEPTNHLDIDSREALEDALEDYPGTLLAVSHDRYFINRIAQTIWAIDGGRLIPHLGGFDDYREKRNCHQGPFPTVKGNPVKGQKRRSAAEDKQNTGERRLRLEEKIAALEQQLSVIEAQMEAPEYCSDVQELARLQNLKDELVSSLDHLYTLWMEE